MANEDTLVAAIRRVIPEIRDAVLDEPIKVWGNDPEGNPYGGHTTLRKEASYGTFRGFRDRRIESGLDVVADAVRPSTLEAVVRGAITTDQKEA